MQLSLYTQVLLWIFALAVILGAVANKTHFCTMGAVSDLVNIGDSGRFRAWVLAIAVAILGVMALEAAGVVDMTLTTANETSNPPYRTAMFVWPRYLLGGLLFGIGMTLGSGCGNKTIVRIGGGNLKSIVVLACIALGAYLMLFTDFFYLAFFQWMQPLAVDFAGFGIASQDAGAVAAGLTGADDPATLRYTLGAVAGVVLLAWAFGSRDLRGSIDNMLGGVVVGLVVVGAWYVTAGPLGRELLEELAFAEVRPYAAGAQSFTFIAPTAHAVQYAAEGFDAKYLTIGLVALLGVLGGSFLWALVSRGLRLEWFAGGRDLANHVVGGLLMGIGGVLAMGCTIGQGITGISTLSLGGPLAFASIVLGAAVTMKIQYYKLLYEDATLGAALVTALVDLHLLPGSLRRLEAL